MLGACALSPFGRPVTDDPEQAFGRLRSALQSKDWGAVYTTAASPSTRRSFDADFQKVKADLVEKGGESMFAESVLGVSKDEYLGMSARDFFVRMSEVSGTPAGLLSTIPDSERMRSATIVDTKVEGEEATLTVELEGEPREIELFREDGRWYFRLLDLD